MNDTKLLDKIKDVEEESKKILEKAEKRKEKIISRAEQEAITIIENLEDELSTYQSEQVNKAKKRISGQREKLVSEGRKDAEAERKKAEKNIGKAVDYLISEFMREVGQC